MNDPIFWLLLRPAACKLSREVISAAAVVKRLLLLLLLLPVQTPLREVAMQGRPRARVQGRLGRIGSLDAFAARLSIRAQYQHRSIFGDCAGSKKKDKS
jgi:hypothetical protein